MRKGLNSLSGLGVSGPRMFRSRRFLLCLLPVLLLAGVCFPVVDVLDGPEILGTRGDFSAEEHVHSGAYHGCLAVESGKGLRRRIPTLSAKAPKRSPKIVSPRKSEIRGNGVLTGEAVVIMQRGWPFLRRSALAPRAPDRVV